MNRLIIKPIIFMLIVALICSLSIITIKDNTYANQAGMSESLIEKTETENSQTNPESTDSSIKDDECEITDKNEGKDLNLENQNNGSENILKNVNNKILKSSEDTTLLDDMTAGGLQNRIDQADDGDEIHIENDIELNDHLNISKSITFIGDGGTKFLKTTGGSLHAEITGSNTSDMEVTFKNVILDGQNQGGGIKISNGMTLKNAVIKNCIQNSSDMGGALTVSPESNVTLIGGSYTNNYSGNNGGGIYVSNSSNLYVENSKINNNSSEEYGGGIFLGSNCGVRLQGDTTVNDNNSKYGGGIAVSSDTNVGLGYEEVVVFSSGVFADETVSISNNRAVISGGGFYLNESASLQTDDEDKVLISNNVAGTENVVGDGGGIYTESLGNVAIGAATTFSANEATIPYKLIDQNDIDLHSQQIHTDRFTYPFDNAYSNYDINYRSDEPYNLYNVYFMVNGELVETITRVVEGSIINAPSIEVPDGYSLSEWYTDQDGENVWDSRTPIIQDTTLYAFYLAIEGDEPERVDDSQNQNTETENCSSGNENSSDPGVKSVSYETFDDFMLTFMEILAIVAILLMLMLYILKRKNRNWL